LSLNSSLELLRRGDRQERVHRLVLGEPPPRTLALTLQLPNVVKVLLAGVLVVAVELLVLGSLAVAQHERRSVQQLLLTLSLDQLGVHVLLVLKLDQGLLVSQLGAPHLALNLHLGRVHSELGALHPQSFLNLGLGGNHSELERGVLAALVVLALLLVVGGLPVLALLVDVNGELIGRELAGSRLGVVALLGLEGELA